MMNRLLSGFDYAARDRQELKACRERLEEYIDRCARLETENKTLKQRKIIFAILSVIASVLIALGITLVSDTNDFNDSIGSVLLIAGIILETLVVVFGVR